MHDSDSRRDKLERFKRLLTPLKKLIALTVALELHVEIEFQRAHRTEEIHLYRVIDYQINRHQGFDDFRIATE